MRATGLGLALLLGLSACATGPGIEVTSHGLWPASSSFQLAISNVGEHQAELSDAIIQRLRLAHLTPTASAPDLMVEGVYSRRPGQIGAKDTLSTTDATWLAKPLSPHWWGRTPAVLNVTVVLTDARSGREVYRASATKVADGRDAPDIAGLVNAALGPPPAPAGH